MATGDRINIADKDTLDLVKSDTTNILSSSSSANSKLGATTDNAGSTSVFAYLKSILANLAGGPPRYITDASKYRLSTVSVPQINSGSTTVQSVTASGYLYGVVCTTVGYAESGYRGDLLLEVNGTTMMTKNLATNVSSGTDAVGFLTPDYLTPTYQSSNSTTGIPVYRLGTREYTFNSSFRTSLATNTGFTVLPVPIKFSNFDIKVMNNNAVVHVTFIYILD